MASDANTTESYHFVRLRDGVILKSKNPELLLSPASTTKLVTTAAALSTWGPYARRETKWYALGSVQKGVLKGDLLVKGDGDPFLVLEHLWQIACDLRSLGLKEVTGSLVLDNSLFAKDLEAEKGLRDFRVSSNSYDAPVSALAVSFNTVALAVAPGDKPAAPARVQLDPYPLDGIEVVNHATTGPACKAGQKSCPDSLEATRTSLGQGRIQITLSGAIAFGKSVKKVYRSVEDPVAMSGAYLRGFLKQEGITIRGSTKEFVGTRVPSGATLLYTWASQPLHQLIQSTNYYSNNYMSDTIWKTLGATLRDHSVTYQDGFQVVDRFLRKEVGIEGAYKLENGSGYSTENKLTVKQMVALLRHMHQRQDLFASYLESLPTAGQTGSLKNRFKNLPANVVVKAKTGTLREPLAVSALGGYCIHPKHGMIAFAVLYNGKPGLPQPTQDDLHTRAEELFVTGL